MLVKQLGGIHLSVNTLFETEHYVLAIMPLGSIELWKLHKDLTLLGTLAERKCEINLT
jgi:hypothetical protein